MVSVFGCYWFFSDWRFCWFGDLSGWLGLWFDNEYCVDECRFWRCKDVFCWDGVGVGEMYWNCWNVCICFIRLEFIIVGIVRSLGGLEVVDNLVYENDVCYVVCWWCDSFFGMYWIDYSD